MSAEIRQSKAEMMKRASRRLRGSIADGLDGTASHFEDADHQLLKFHGIYEGYDRDTATALKQSGAEKDYEFMVRVKVPAGHMTAGQYLALDALAQRHGGGKLRITTRQTLQFHGVDKRNLKATVAGINQSLLTSFGACGDVVRNVTATPAPIADAVHRTLQAEAKRLSAALAPRTRAYHEIWVAGEPVSPGPAEDEPLYGPTYLPRKFKIGLAAPEDNWIDVLTNDLGIIALFDGDRLEGYNLAVGGGLGMTHNKPKTYPRLATPVAFVAPDELLDAVKAVIALQRDHGDRGDRKHARLKYLVDDKGLPWIQATLARYLGKPLVAPRAMPRFQVREHMGWHDQGDGRCYFGLSVASGRIVDRPDQRLATALRRIFTEIAATPIFTPSQDILIADIAVVDRARVEALLAEHGVALPGSMTPVRRWALACPALPTCGLALTEAERIREPVIDGIEDALRRHGLIDERISVRITGCPNGCARPYAGDIGIVGRMPGFFALFLGGDFEGTRLNSKVLDRVAQADIATVLEPIFAWFAQAREAGEGFGDFCARVGVAALRDRIGALPERRSA
ncbi:MAG: NADPH-dependent assimilatory sulfite reductase hemoprotein subunit [Pseudomonadota bacterium]